LAGQEWIASVLPRIRAKATTENAEICFVQDALVDDGASWLICAETDGGERRFARYDRARLDGDRAAFSLYGFARAGPLGAFLDRLRIGAPGPVYVILEPLPPEDAAAVDRLATASHGMLHVFYLPDQLTRLEGVTAAWRQALAAMKEHARVRD